MCREEEGIKEIIEMKQKYSATVSTNSRGLIRTADIESPIEMVSQAIYICIILVDLIQRFRVYIAYNVSSKKVV